LDLHASDAAPRATRIPSETARAQYNPECRHCGGGGADVRRDLSRRKRSRHGPNGQFGTLRAHSQRNFSGHDRTAISSGGYALSNCIHDELERRGLTSDREITKRIGVSFPQNLRALFLDKVLQDTERDLSKLPDQCAHAIRGLGGDDVGYVDFAKLAFYLFGLHIRAFYYLFFLIYGLSLLVALIERHRDPMGHVYVI